MPLWKVRKESELTTCEKCQKTFGSRAGWKYHTDNRVCEIVTPDEAYLYKMAAQEQEASSLGVGRKRKAAAKAASILAASLSGNGGGGSGDEAISNGSGDPNFSDGSSALILSDDTDDSDDMDDDVDDDDDDISEDVDVDDDGDVDTASSKWKAGKKSRRRRPAAAAKKKGSGQYRQKGPGRISRMTVHGYSSTAFTHGTASNNPRRLRKKASDLVIEGRLEGGHSAAAAGGGASGSGGGSTSVGRGAGVRLQPAAAAAAAAAADARARLATDLEPGAWPGALAKKKKAIKRTRRTAAEAESQQSARGDGGPDACDDAEDGTGGEECATGGAGVGTEKRSWREMPELRGFCESPPAWEVRRRRATYPAALRRVGPLFRSVCFCDPCFSFSLLLFEL